MKKFWIFNLITAGLLLILFLVINYSCGIFDHTFGIYAAWVILSILVLQFIMGLVYVVICLKKETLGVVTWGLAYMVFALLTILFVGNFMFLQNHG